MTPEVDLGPVMPELILVGAGIVALLVGAIARRVEPLVLLFIAMAGVAGAAAASLLLWDWDGGLTVLAGAVATDRFAVVARLILLGVAALGLVLGHHYFQRSGEQRNEFFALVLFATSGMTLITASADLITMFLALEILSLSLYVLTGSSARLGSVEGAMKYFLLGAFSSAFFLYGVAMAYGATGSTRLAEVATALGGRTGSMALALAAMVLLAIGFAFKVAAVPFHMWTPDVYQGAPTAVTAFMSAGTKVAAFAAFMRVFNVAFQPLGWDWTPVIWALAAVSMIVGSVLAIAQTDIKRMLAYSSIAHAGFVLTGMTAPGSTGMSASLFYLLAYALMIVGAFGVVMLVSSRGEAATSLASYRGLYRQSPLLAGLLSLFLLSMAGIPPTAGFIAKVGVFGAAIDAGHWELALIGVLASVVAAFFYIRVMVLMYMQEPSGDHEPDASLAPRVAIAIPAVGTLLLGVLPGLVTDFLSKASVIRW
ncbi:MAG TPA: NADH-quinone oxidoreductase subunit NuoN [Actinomycetota bacterium]|nr:NADH-quinone oxidoreductase subunit NuoN [Actinomycetota bacterium]